MKKFSRMNIYLIFYDLCIFILFYAICILTTNIYNVSIINWKYIFIGSAVFSVVKLIVFYLMKTYNTLLKYVGAFEITKLCIVFVIVESVLGMIFIQIPEFQMDIIPFILTLFSQLLFIIIGRIAKKQLINYRKTIQKSGLKVIPTLLVGAGSGCKLVIDEIQNNDKLFNHPIAIIDDDPNKIGKIFYGFEVEGPIFNAEEIIKNYDIEEVIITIANIEKDRLQEIIHIISGCNVKIKRLLTMSEEGKDTERKVINVKVEDLLKREVIDLKNPQIKNMIKDTTVLVTGGGGSIGGELVRQIALFEPKKLVILDIYENNAYDIQMELMIKKDIYKNLDLEVLIGSTYNYDRCKKVFETYKPDFVFHAAAYKHVPLMEKSPEEAIRTNVIGTYNIAKLSYEYNVRKMVLVSTDKAVRPTNVMGATKRFAELIIQGFNTKGKTKYSAVRFGNVLGSNGSVIPLFKKQIEEGGPITVTHKEINRFFMTIPEAASLILQSGAFAKGGEIFILDMGQPVKIVDLAERMIRIAGYRPYEEINIVFTGLRPGEKLYEELLVDYSKSIRTSNKKIFIEEISTKENVESDIEFIRKVFDEKDNLEIKKMLQKIIYTYTIDERK